MSWTCMQSFSFIPLTASEENIFEYFFENLPFMLSKEFLHMEKGLGQIKGSLSGTATPFNYSSTIII